MASPNAGRNDRLRRSYYEPETPHFLRLLHPELLRLGKIEFPTAFIRRYGKDMPKWVLLKVPSGETWTIDLEKHNGRVWLGKGWKNFVEYYCISAEYSITFGFVGNSMFHTVIFDESGQEIDYPIKCSCHKMPKHDDELPPPQKAKACEAMNIDMETTDEVDDDYYAFLSGLHVNIGTGRASVPGEATYRPSVEATLASERFKSVEATLASERFKSKYPFFRLILKKSQMQNGHAYVPRKIQLQCKMEQGIHAVKLKHSGKSWPAKLTVYANSNAFFCQGWAAFVKENSLKMGDICMFEVIERNVFNAVFFRCA